MAMSMFSRLKYFYSSSSIDHFIFKLCYRWTVLLLVVFSLVVTCRLLLGHSFACLNEANDVPLHYATVKCYADGTYIKPAKLAALPTASPLDDSQVKDSQRYQNYYSWVNLVFLVMAFNFYLPHILWKTYERGYLRRLTAGVQTFFDKEEKRGLELCYLAKYVLITQGEHSLYTSMYIFFESCNFGISLAQTLWLVFFFNATGVPDNLPLKLESWTDFRNFYFPSTGTCKIFFPAIERSHYLLCELPLNRLYMKMFLFLHAWYIFLTILCGLVLVYRIILFAPSFRIFVIKSYNSLAEESVLKSLCHRMSYSDWFFLTTLQHAMTDIDFAQMIDKIAILSQSKEERIERRVSFFDNGLKDSDDSNATSPL